jgi:uncharacterized membrane protein
MNYAGPAAIGALSGLRSLSAPAVLAKRMGGEKAERIASVLALSEMALDKLPFVPDRTKAPSLAFRALSGAVCGYLIAGRKGSSTQKWMSAFVGGAAAVAASYAGLQFRRKVGLPKIVAAFAEDALVVGAGAIIRYEIGA